MARRRNRPNALQVSFPGEFEDVPSSSTSLLPKSSGTAPRSTLEKRKNETLVHDDSRKAKRPRLPSPAFSLDRTAELECADLVLTGEDPFAGEDGDGEPDKPIRVLSDFVIYDPKHRNEMVPLSAIEEDDGVDRQFEGAGYAFPYVINDEDEGQEDGDGVDPELRYIRLGAILRYTFDYTQANDPVWIETTFAWYILKIPSKAYVPFFQHFFSPRRVAQIVVSTALKQPLKSYEEFLRRFVATVDVFGHTYSEDDIWNAIPEIQEAVEDHDDPQTLNKSPIIRQILQKATPSSQQQPTRRKGTPKRKQKPPPINSLLNNLDAAVLRAENQSATHVTPFIASLAQGLVYEELVVVGGRPPPTDTSQKEVQRVAAHQRLCELVMNAKKQRKIVDIQRADHVARGSRYCKALRVEGESYKIGDFVLIPRRFGMNTKNKHYTPPRNFPDNIQDVHPTSIIADYFWFAQIIFGDIDASMLHVRWLQHSSQTMMEELGHPQELFLNDLCDHVPFGAVIAKIIVHEDHKPPPKADEYFVKFIYNINQGTYLSVDCERHDLAAHSTPPYNCAVCPLLQQQDQDKSDHQLKDEEGLVNGVAYGGHQYHLDDFVLYRAESGPAHIGYITGFKFRPMIREDVMTEVQVRRVGRMYSLGDVLPADIIRDERHVFLTDELVTVLLTDFIRVCYVFPQESIPDLESWLSLAPYHFYIKYVFPSMTVKSWEARKALPCDELAVCTPCITGKLAELKQTELFLRDAKRHPRLTEDLFAGVLTFSEGLAEGSGCLKVTDAIEISPSAAKTIMRNFPKVAVHNQCANEILRYSIKQNSGQQPEAPKQIYDGETSVPTLKKPDIIVAGVPCQSHSRLNMYKKADDVKSNLVLTALSFVDHQRPSLFYFENVPGFLQFTFDATQSGIHRVEGGIPMGGLKLLVRALVEMKYQVRFSLLQAGHYGAPQRRHRFFLIAAMDKHPLPEFPQPSHDFPVNSNLEIKLPNEDTVRPFLASNGTAPHPFVTIDDAIGDLLRFDWEPPRLHRLSAEKRKQLEMRKQKNIPALACESSSTHCGYSGIVPYHHAPKTTYQVAARAKPTKNLQHFTRTFDSQKVERVISIPLKANADYRDLRPDQHEWQVSNPLSAVAKKDYRPGLYGRLDHTQFFPTTVTNMEPTAKQSRVLNPYCDRMFTVRELARSQGFPDHFVFEAIGHSVVTMHRQIGNAVPLPVGIALGRELRNALFKKWQMTRQDAIPVSDDE